MAQSLKAPVSGLRIDTTARGWLAAFAWMPCQEAAATHAGHELLHARQCYALTLSAATSFPHILKHGEGGAIINTSSGAGIIGIKGSPAYTAAKHGVIGLTKAVALDYAGQKIRINAICPGYIATPMMDRFTGGTAEGRAKVIAEEPAGRMGTPEEIAAAAVWLCSDAAAFMIGHAMVMDGGQTIQ